MVADCEHAYRDMRAQFGARLQRSEPMSRHTSYGIGGPADLYVEARAPEELVQLADCARAHDLAVLWLGSGTNVLVADAGVRGLVVTNSCQGMTMSDDGLVVAQSGTLLRELAQRAVRLGWAGLEWAVGIPGTVGGAVVGNAGAYGGCMADAVAWATVLEDGAQRQLTAAELGYSYRTSALKRESQPRRRMVLAAALQLRRGDPAELAQVAERNNAQRVARTPQGPSAGSVFKRTLQYPAGFLVEQAGLKGQRLGGAEISAQHANYILNLGGASAADVRALIELAQERVWANFALRLEPEIEFVGEWS